MKRRLRKTVKWTLTVFAVLTLVAWVGSCWWLVGSLWKWGANDIVVNLSVGQIGIDISVHYEYHFNVDVGPVGILGLLHCNRNRDPRIDWWFEYFERGGWPHGRLRIPLWLPFLLLGAPAGWLWWRGDRRFPETACQSCGYDLSGAPHERCPECGKAI